MKPLIAGLLCYALAAPFTFAQQQGIAPEMPAGSKAVQPYRPPVVPPTRVADSTRIAALVKGGKLYLTLQDAIALALENNVDLEVSRYSESTLTWRLRRAEAGGSLPGVPSGSSQVSGVTSGQGVLGSQAAAGVSGGGGNGGGAGGGGTTISQVGPTVQTYDPVVQESTTFSHKSLPQANSTQAGSVLVQNQRAYSASIQQGLVTGGSATLSYSNRYLNENAPTDVLNPSYGTSVSLSVRQNLLQGFGKRLNERNIEVARLNLGMNDLNFHTQVTTVVNNVVNAYWSLASAYDDLKAKDAAFSTAKTFLDENKQRLELGALAAADIPSSENQVAQAKQNLINSQTAIIQRQITLKNLISRTGTVNAEIVPLDQISIPEKDDLEPVRTLVETAYKNRSDLLASKENLHVNDVSGLGTANGIKPTLLAFTTLSQSGLGGTARVVKGQSPPDAYFVGGLGTALGQVFRRNFPTESVGAFFSANVNNRQAQADLGIDQLQTRQQELSYQKALKQAQVDISNSIVALKQARVRYDAAKENRILSEQLLTAEQEKYKLGESTPYNVLVQQRDLVTAKSNELAALVSYQNARTSLDQTLGLTLEAHNVNLSEAKAAKVARESVAPAK